MYAPLNCLSKVEILDMVWIFLTLFAKLSSSSSPVELSTALILIISTHTHPRDSSNEALLDYLERWNLVWKLYSTKLGKLTN